MVLISPKPSVARWALRKKYEEVNAALSELASAQDGISFADVWTPALNADGQVLDHIFIQDNLHMNAEGYAIWEKAIGPFLKECR